MCGGGVVATELGQDEKLMRGECAPFARDGKCLCCSSGVGLMGARPRSVNTKWSATGLSKIKRERNAKSWRIHVRKIDVGQI